MTYESILKDLVNIASDLKSIRVIAETERNDAQRDLNAEWIEFENDDKYIEFLQDTIQRASEGFDRIRDHLKDIEYVIEDIEDDVHYADIVQKVIK